VPIPSTSGGLRVGHDHGAVWGAAVGEIGNRVVGRSDLSHVAHVSSKRPETGLGHSELFV